MTVVFRTPEALARLEDIEAYIAKDAPTAAEEVITRLLARSRQLETAPQSDRVVPDYPRADPRELLERPYRLIYRITAERDPHCDALPPALAAQSELVTQAIARQRTLKGDGTVPAISAASIIRAFHRYIDVGLYPQDWADTVLDLQAGELREGEA